VRAKPIVAVGCASRFCASLNLQKVNRDTSTNGAVSQKSWIRYLTGEEQIGCRFPISSARSYNPRRPFLRNRMAF
jgi:hypothetical protein